LAGFGLSELEKFAGQGFWLKCELRKEGGRVSGATFAKDGDIETGLRASQKGKGLDLGYGSLVVMRTSHRWGLLGFRVLGFTWLAWHAIFAWLESRVPSLAQLFIQFT
jgi:hypothetical protein